MYRISFSRYGRGAEKTIPSRWVAEELLANSLLRSVPIKSWRRQGMEISYRGEMR